MIACRKDFKDAYLLLIAKSKRPTLKGPYRLPEAINEDSQTAPSILAVYSKEHRNSDDCVTEAKIAVTRSPLWQLHNTVDNSATGLHSRLVTGAGIQEIYPRGGRPLSLSLFSLFLSFSLSPLPEVYEELESRFSSSCWRLH